MWRIHNTRSVASPYGRHACDCTGLRAVGVHDVWPERAINVLEHIGALEVEWQIDRAAHVKFEKAPTCMPDLLKQSHESAVCTMQRIDEPEVGAGTECFDDIVKVAACPTQSRFHYLEDAHDGLDWFVVTTLHRHRALPTA